jgi:hypothetical protein
MPIPILNSVQHWHCPSCGATDVTHQVEPHTRFHPCPGLAGLSAPLASGVSGARMVVVEREDYIGSEDVTLVEGRPVMAISTEYSDGHTDTAVYAPTAHVGT